MKPLFLRLEDFQVIEAILSQFEESICINCEQARANCTCPTFSEDPATLSDSEKITLWKVRKIINNIQKAIERKNLNASSTNNSVDVVDNHLPH